MLSRESVKGRGESSSDFKSLVFKKKEKKRKKKKKKTALIMSYS